MASDEPDYTSDPTPAQIEAAKLHATAWEDAAGSLLQNMTFPETLKRMGVTHDQMVAVKWLAFAVAGGYRKIVNGANIQD